MTRGRDPEAVSLVLLAFLIVTAFIVGLPPIVTVVAGALQRSSLAATVRGGSACNICGIVEQVREVKPAPRHDVSTVAGGGTEGIAVLLGALSGRMTIHAATVYEVAVRLQDGSLRVLQSGAPPQWKPGDHVKVVMGRVEPMS